MLKCIFEEVTSVWRVKCATLKRYSLSDGPREPWCSSNAVDLYSGVNLVRIPTALSAVLSDLFFFPESHLAKAL